MCFVKIRWEKNNNTKNVTQCYKCQSFGHIAKNCFREVVCPKCSKNHNVGECQASSDNYLCKNYKRPLNLKIAYLLIKKKKKL